VPHTLSVTTLKSWKRDTLVNLEVDVLARYVVNFLEASRDTIPT
jgi:riboflavin synthase alpha subunit